MALTQRLPAVLEALGNGSIDLARAKVFVRGTEHLELEDAQNVSGVVLGEAASLTTGQIGARAPPAGSEC